jgi:hypothetical protein
MKFKVTLYQETYTEVEIEADSLEQANDLVLSGKFTENDIVDVTVKESEIIN